MGDSGGMEIGVAECGPIEVIHRLIVLTRLFGLVVGVRRRGIDDYSGGRPFGRCRIDSGHGLNRCILGVDQRPDRLRGRVRGIPSLSRLTTGAEANGDMKALPTSSHLRPQSVGPGRIVAK
jgi:hypothetical protein